MAIVYGDFDYFTGGPVYKTPIKRRGATLTIEDAIKINVDKVQKSFPSVKVKRFTNSFSLQEEIIFTDNLSGRSYKITFDPLLGPTSTNEFLNRETDKYLGELSRYYKSPAQPYKSVKKKTDLYMYERIANYGIF